MASAEKSKVVVRVICGPPGSGKTARLLQAYADCVRDGHWDEALYLVPTVRVADLVRGRLHEVGLPGLFDFRVMTFAEAAETLLVANHVPAAAISDLQQRFIVRHVLEQMTEAELGPLAAQRAGPGLVTCLVEDINELKAAGVEPKDLLAALEKEGIADPVALATARVYQQYQTLLRSSSPELFDGPGMLWQASRQLDRAVEDRRQARPFDTTRLVLADGFSDFTTVELQVLARLASLAGECIVSLTYQPDDQEAPPELQAIPKRTFEALRMHLGGIGRLEVECLPDSQEVDTDLSYLRRFMFRRSVGPRNGKGEDPWHGSVTVMQAPGPWAEVRMVAREVKQLIGPAAGEERLRPGQIGIIARSLDEYRTALQQVFSEYGLPLFVAGGERAVDRPCVRFVGDLLDLIEEDYPRVATVAVLDAAWDKLADTKGALAESRPADYVSRQAGITGGAEAWAKNLEKLIGRLRQSLPAGEDLGDAVDTEEDEDADDQSARRASRRERRSVLNAAVAVREAFRRLREHLDKLTVPGTRAQLTDRLLRVLGELGVSERLDIPGNPYETAANRRAWEALLTALEAYVHADRHLGSAAAQVVTPQVFAAEVREILEDLRVPAQGRGEGKVLALDVHGALQVTFDAVFLLGLTEGSFPRRAHSDPLLPDSLRVRLAQQCLPVRKRIGEADEEAYLFQLAVSAARKRLYLCYSDTDAAGQPILRSYYLDEAERLLPSLKDAGSGLRRMRLRDVVPKLWQAGSRREMAERALWLRHNQPAADDASLLGAAEALLSSAWHGVFQHAAVAANVERTRSGWTPPGQGANGQPQLGPYDGNIGAVQAVGVTLARLFGPDTVFSVSNLGQYGKCPMAFMFQRLLGIEALPEPGEELEPAALGLLLHAILAQFYRRRIDAGRGRVSAEQAEAAWSELEEVAHEMFAKFECDGQTGHELLWPFTREAALRKLRTWLKAEAAAGDRLKVPGLEPYLFEHSYGDSPETALVIETDQAGPVRVRGRIDRIDLVGQDGFFLFDYKTGSSVPSAKDIREGRDLQMPLYALAGEKVLFGGSDGPQRTCRGWAYVRVGWPEGEAFAGKVLARDHGCEKDGMRGLIKVSKEKVGEHVAGIRSGRFIWPTACSDQPVGYCDYKLICRYEFRKVLRRIEAKNTGESDQGGTRGEC